MKFEEINLKFKKFEKVQDYLIIKFKKVRIQIQSQMLLDDTQYFQYYNTVELHAVQCTSTKFLTIAYFSNKGYNSVHKSSLAF